MRRSMIKKRMVRIVFLMIILIQLTGCSDRRKEQDEGLVELAELTESEELTDTGSGEIPEEENAKKAEERTKEGQRTDSAGKESEAPEDTAEVYVHVCGQVTNPGVYRVPSGSRLFEVIEAAGGLLEDAADELLNQAAQVQDGQQVYVPSREEADRGMSDQRASNLDAAGQSVSNPGVSGSSSDPGFALAADDGKINLNTASKEQLMTLSGIGEAKANSIIAYREGHGGFKKIEELMEVEGIKEGVFNKVKDQIKVS